MPSLLFRKTLRDLRRSLAQSVALVVIVALGVASFIALVGAYRDLGTSYNRTYERLKFADATFDVAAAPATVAAKIRALPGVQSVTGRLVIDSGLAMRSGSGGETTIRCRLIGIPARHHPAVDDLLMTRGAYLNSASRKEVIVESHFAKVYSLKPGDRLSPYLDGRPTTLSVVGVAASPEYLIVSASREDIIPDARHFAVLFVPLGTLQRAFGLEGTVNNLAVLFKPQARGPSVVTEARSLLEPYGLREVTLRKDQPSNAALRIDLEGFREIGFLMPALILLAAAAALFVMIGRHVQAQRTQIGLMRAIGYSSRSILLHYLTHSLLVALVGSMLGIAAGYPLGYLITGAYARELGIPLVESRLYADSVAIGVGMSLVVALVAGIFPALKASRMAPATAVRSDPANALARPRRLPPVRFLRLSVWSRLPLRNLFRIPSRSLSTLIGVVFAFVLVLTSWSLIDSMQRIVADNFSRVERWAIQATFRKPVPMGALSTIAAHPGIRKVEPMLQMPVSISAARADRRQEVDALLTALPPDSTLHRIALDGGLTPREALAGGRVVISDTFARKLGVRAGGIIQARTLLGTKALEVGGIDDELESSVAYVSLATAEGWIPLPLPVFNKLLLSVAPGETGPVESYLYSLPGASSVQIKSTVVKSWDSLMGFYYLFMDIILLFSFATAFAILFNTMTVNVIEQQRELATMRSIGAPGGRVAWLVIVELFALWGLALLPGLLLGSWVARGMGETLQSDLFSINVTVSPASYLASAAGILVVMILAGIPAIRRVNRLNLAAATKALS